MTAQPHHPDVAEAVRQLLTLRELVDSFALSFGVIAARPDGVVLTPESASRSAEALASWGTLLDATVALLVPQPVALPAPAPPPPPRPKPRLVALNGEVLS